MEEMKEVWREEWHSKTEGAEDTVVIFEREFGVMVAQGNYYNVRLTDELMQAIKRGYDLVATNYDVKAPQTIQVEVTPWMQYLDRFFCTADEMGCRPCDRGCPCDECSYPEGNVPEFKAWCEQHNIQPYKRDMVDVESGEGCDMDCYYMVGGKCQYWNWDACEEPRECDRE